MIYNLPNRKFITISKLLKPSRSYDEVLKERVVSTIPTLPKIKNLKNDDFTFRFSDFFLGSLQSSDEYTARLVAPDTLEVLRISITHSEIVASWRVFELNDIQNERNSETAAYYEYSISCDAGLTSAPSSEK